MRSISFIIKFYYRLLGKWVFVLVLFSSLAAILEGLGASSVLALLQKDSESKVAVYLKNCFTNIGIEYNYLSIISFIVGVMFLRSTFFICQGILEGKLNKTLSVELRRLFVDAVFQIQYVDFQKYNSGFLNNFLVREIVSVTSTFIQLSGLFVYFMSAIVYFSIPLFLSPKFTIFLILFVTPIAFVVFYLMHLTRKVSFLQTKVSSHYMQKVLQAFLNFKYLKATSSEAKMTDQILKEDRHLAELNYKMQLYRAFSNYFFDPIILGVILGIVYYNITYNNGEIVEQLFIVFLLMKATNTVLGAQGQVRKILERWGSLSIVEKTLEELQKKKESNLINGKLKPSIKGSIELKNITFYYPDTDEAVIKNLSLKIPSGRTVAFVGSSGSGKSTLSNIILGLLHAESGKVLIDGKSLSEIDLAHFRKHVSYVTQDPVIFPDSIRENITLWDDKVDDSRLSHAAQKAFIDEFISDLPEGYSSKLSESGMNLSGGQKQRISIARELYKDSKIIVFDEATSALDSKTEKLIQENIESLKGEKTMILIAHRLSTVKNADCIYVMKEGQILESGTFEELKELDGEFKKMLALQ